MSTTTIGRSAIAPTPLLSRILVLDAATSAAAGLVLLLGAGHTADLLGLPATLQRCAGAILLVFAAFVASVARQDQPTKAAILGVIAVNGFWVVDSVLLLVLGLVPATSLGIAFVLAQAAIVAVLAELQVVGLRRSAQVLATS